MAVLTGSRVALEKAILVGGRAAENQKEGGRNSLSSSLGPEKAGGGGGAGSLWRVLVTRR